MASFSSSAASEEKRNCSLHNTKDTVSSEQGKYKESYSDHREKTKNNETNLKQAKYILTESASYQVSQNVNGIIKRSFYIIFEYPINHDKRKYSAYAPCLQMENMGEIRILKGKEHTRI